jgi:hypothetical protein
MTQDGRKLLEHWRLLGRIVLGGWLLPLARRLNLGIAPLLGESLTESERLQVGFGIVIALPEQAVHRIDRGLHNPLHFFVRDMGKLGPSGAYHAGLSRVQIFDRTVAKGKCGDRLGFDSKRRIDLRFHCGASATLHHSAEELERAEILLHVQDAASPVREEQKAQVEKVLTELAVSTKPVIQVLNKADLVPAQELVHLSSEREAILVSSLQHTGLEQLLIAIDAVLVVDPLVESSFVSRNPKVPSSPRSKAERSSMRSVSRETSSSSEPADQHPFLTVTVASM